MYVRRVYEKVSCETQVEYGQPIPATLRKPYVNLSQLPVVSITWSNETLHYWLSTHVHDAMGIKQGNIISALHRRRDGDRYLDRFYACKVHSTILRVKLGLSLPLHSSYHLLISPDLVGEYCWCPKWHDRFVL